MELETEIDNSAFVGIAFNQNVIYNVVERDAEFIHTGMSIINFLKNDKNKFLSDIIQSQSYESIKLIFDDNILYGEFYDKNNSNIDSFDDVYTLMIEQNNYEYFYVYDFVNDVLIVKIPEEPEIIALNYKDSYDVRDFINRINY